MLFDFASALTFLLGGWVASALTFLLGGWVAYALAGRFDITLLLPFAARSAGGRRGIG